jgi:transposase-like protein
VTAGTIFQDSRLGLRTWFRAIWWVCGQKNGVSALGLQRILGFGSYETAWTWLHKLRRAMVRPGRDRLTGEVEVDETYVGGLEPGKGGRSRGSKALVGIAAQGEGKGIGRIRIGRIPDASAESLLPFVQGAVEPGSKVTTDGWHGYERLKDVGYRHTVRVIRGSGKTASTLLPRVHRVASWLKRWLLGTHQGAVSRDHLDYYLDEFTFRFNRRTSRSRGLLFYRLLENAVRISPAPYAVLTARRAPARP